MSAALHNGKDHFGRSYVQADPWERGKQGWVPSL